LTVPVQPLALAAQVGSSLDAQLQPGRLDGMEHLRGDQLLQGLAGQTLTKRLGMRHIAKIAQIIEWFVIGVIVNPHLLPTPPAEDESAQERLPTARCAGSRG